VRVFWGGLTAAAALLGLTAPEASAQTVAPTVCEAGRVTNIFVDNRSIFQVDELPEGSRLRWIYKFANALHITTRESFILREILFAEGDCLDPLLLEESGRLLRFYPFIETADVFPVQQPDGSYHVVIDTQDRWTTQFDLGVSFDQGLQLERADLTEKNLLGQGILAQVIFKRRREQRDTGFKLQQPRLFGTRTDAQFGWGKTRVGHSLEEEISYPFFSEVGRWAVRQTFHRRDQVFSYSTGAETDITHALLPFEEEWAEVSFAARLGQPGNLTLLGVGLTRERIEFTGFPGDLEVAINDDFGETPAAPPEVQAAVSGQVNGRVTTRLNLMFGQRNLRFTRARGLDALDGDQDIRLGTDIGLTLGRSIGVLGIEGVESPADLFGRLRLFAGHDPGSSYVFMNLAVEGSRLTTGANRWRDVIGEVNLFSYLRFPAARGHTFFVRASGSGAWSAQTPFQLTLGGREGVRGFREEEDPGAERMLFTFEDRILVRWPFPESLDFGFTLFADAGRVWSGDVPYGVDSNWKGTVGFGLRLGAARTRGVGRIDLAFPLGGRVGQKPVFRLTLYELLGIASGLRDSQLERTRRSRIGPDFFVTGR
jgi:hypothetical protein